MATALLLHYETMNDEAIAKYAKHSTGCRKRHLPPTFRRMISVTGTLYGLNTGTWQVQSPKAEVQPHGQDFKQPPSPYILSNFHVFKFQKNFHVSRFSATFMSPDFKQLSHFCISSYFLVSRF